MYKRDVTIVRFVLQDIEDVDSISNNRVKVTLSFIIKIDGDSSFRSCTLIICDNSKAEMMTSITNIVTMYLFMTSLSCVCKQH